MTRRILIAVPFAVLVLILALFASLVNAEEHEELPEHGHILGLGLEFDEDTGELLSYRKCVDLANNRALPLHSHHEQVHFGQAGEALIFAGNGVAPTAPFPEIPWEDCADFEAIFGPGTQ